MDMISVAFDKTIEDWAEFAEDLNKCLPDDVGIAFDIGDEPMMHHFFCKFIHRIERPWKLRTTLLGPGYQCLRANVHTLAERCVEIVAFFSPNDKSNVYPWLRRVALLMRAGYSVRVETTVIPNEQFLRNVTHGLVNIPIEVVEPPVPLRQGYRRSKQRTCMGEMACIWTDGGFYPCKHCLDANTLGYPVYRYGQLSEPFERQGRENCRLKDCPLGDATYVEKEDGAETQNG